jgi:hypothetical protein
MTAAQQHPMITLPPLSESQQGGPWESVGLDVIPSDRILISMKNAEGKQPKSSIRTANKEYFTGIYHYDYVLESQPQPVAIGTTASTASQHGGFVVVLAKNTTNQPFTSMIGAAKANQEYVSVVVINQTETTSSSNVIAVYGLVTHYGNIRNGKMCYFRIQITGLVEISRPVYAEPGKKEVAKGNSVDIEYDTLNQKKTGSPLIKTLLTKFAQDSIKALK